MSDDGKKEMKGRECDEWMEESRVEDDYVIPFFGLFTRRVSLHTPSVLAHWDSQSVGY